MNVDWKPHAAALADQIAGPGSRWREQIAATARHLFVPRWWHYVDDDGWTLRDGLSDKDRWMSAAYGDLTLVTRVGDLHADHADVRDHPAGRPTSSSTLPGLVVQMYRHARLYPGAEILDIATCSGYGCALLARRFGDDRVTSIDIDPYVTKAAAERLYAVGLHPAVESFDANGPLPGSYDRIISMVSVRPIPASWLTALRPGGRLVTTIADTMAIITAQRIDQDPHNTIHGEPVVAVGQVERDWASFMETRSGPDYPPGLDDMFAAIREHKGERVTRGTYPVIRVANCGELDSVLEVVAPGIDHRYEKADDGRQTAWMLHADGSWARATAHADEPPVVHQAGPRRLWDIFEDIRHYWLTHGYLQLYGAKAHITASGTIHLARGDWRATIG